MAFNRSPATKLADRVRAFAIIKERSFARGKFTLASGKESEFYLDMKPTMFHPEGASLLANLILDRIQDIRPDYIGGLEMGAVPLVSAVVVTSTSTPWPLHGLFVRKKIKDHGTKRLVEGAGDLSGKTVVVIEDVTTSGASAMDAVTAVQDAGATVPLVLSIVDRGEGASEFYKANGIKFDWLFRLEEFAK